MRKPLYQHFRKNIIIITLIITVIFAVMNGFLYLINQTYLETKIEEENQAFLELTTHLMNENDIDVVLEYVEHYTHIHAVEIEMVDDNDTMLFSSNISYRYTKQYLIVTDKGEFTLFIDNTDSVTTIVTENNFLYVNIALLVTYLLAIGILVFYNKKAKDSIENDVVKLVHFINHKTLSSNTFRYDEFADIFDTLKTDLEHIDLLKEQRNINVKGLAHNIKTPLTVLYTFLSHVKQQKPLTKDDQQAALNSAKKINQLVDDLLTENYNNQRYLINLKTETLKIIKPYLNILNTKGITINHTLMDVTVKWNKEDYTRVLENLLNNVYHYSKNDSSVELLLQQNNDITLTITSKPNNLEELDLNKLFQKGYSTATSSTKGLGLYMTKLLVTAVDGTITAQTKENNFIVSISIPSS
ncbi:MAG: HAMP domain-containing histidine kinase [Candidatus Izimaplasma sp.]|nr:HAMP domain-containing histidine kinase [Candidatus Izimaplasma bacterium]